MRLWRVAVFLISWSAMGATTIKTTGEKSGWKRTGRYEEAIELCGAFAKHYPKRVRELTFGTTPEGRPMLALLINPDLAAKKAPLVAIQAGIHPGEIEGKDAGFQFLRDWLERKTAASALDQVSVLFIPVFNVDGHERRGKWNRPNQRGPEEMGWRSTSQNLNLNRDYVKAEAPEMAAMLKLLNEWDPIAYVDLHTTDGADFQHEVSVMVAPSLRGSQELRATGNKISDEIMTRLASHKPLWFYPTLEKEDEPTSGIALWVSLPRFSQAYWAARNRFGILVETHSWKTYENRAKSMYDTIQAIVEMAAKDGKSWQEAAARADKAAAALGGKDWEPAYDHTTKAENFDFLGYAYKQEKSEVSGATRITYDPSKPEIWKIPLYTELFPIAVVKLPKAGYLVPPAHAAWVGAKLSLHGIQFETLGNPQNKPKELEVEVFRAIDATLAKETFEGKTRLTPKGEWRKETRSIPSGTLYVPIAQSRAELVAHIFEPMAPDSLLQWGFFNAHFEKKEYMENYVLEDVARQMLKDRKTKKAFEERIASDPEFAKNPQARLDFFYRLHSSWDERKNLYPIYRVTKKP